MSVTITMTFPTAELAAAALLAINPERATPKDPAAVPVEKSVKAVPVAGQRTAKAEADAAPAKTAADSGPSAASAEAKPQASTAVADVAYTDLQKAILKLHAKDPSATQAIAKQLGLDNFKPLKEDATSERRAQALGLINEKLAELE